MRRTAKDSFAGMMLVAACVCVIGPARAAAWAYLPPQDVDPQVATLANPIPRRVSGQKAALAFSRIARAPDRVTISWADAAAARKAPKLQGDPRSLWRGRFPDKPPVTEPRFYAMGTDGRLFRDELPGARELLPFVVAVDGNPEDGYGGYVLGCAGGEWSFERRGDTFAVAGKDAFAFTFDGTWLAGLQAAARAKPEFFPLADGMSPDMWVTVVSEWTQDDGKWNCAADGWDGYLRRRIAARAKLLSDPRLKETLANGILFNTRRPTTWNHCVAQYFGWRQRPGGSLLVLEEPGRSLKTRDVIAGRMPRGSYLEPRLSYDAKRALFAFVETDGALNPYSMPVNEKGMDDHYYHLWTVNVDGSGLKQLTRGVYEDFMPEFLPDGDVVFMSSRRRSQSRCFWYGYSNRWQAYTMFRMKPDGTDIRQLSWNDVAEWFPTMANNGELLFARWDYIDRDAVRHQNLWSMRPDGTNPKAVWGNETPSPHCTFQPRAIPGSRKIACIASAHHAFAGGPLILIDPSVDENSEEAVTHITPGHYPECADNDKHDYDDASPEAHNDWYNSPHPYGEDLFLVCWSRAPLQYEPSRPAPNDSLGLYVLAADGRREVLWRDGCLCACSPQPLVARPVPPKLESQFDERLAAEKKGEVFLANVYRGLTNAAPGSLKEVRVVQIFPRTAPDQYRPNMGRGGHENARAVLGTVPLEDDGSARFIVPAQKPVLFQVLDKDGFAWRTMRSTTSLMPGERVSCVGCHESKREVSYGPISGALKQPARELARTPEAGRPWGFVENVQPIFDAKCVSCHGDEKPPKGIALTRTPDPRFGQKPDVKEVGPLQYSAPFTKSYATLCFTDEPTGCKPNSMRFEKPFKWWKVRMGKDRLGRHVPMVPCWVEYNQVQTTPEGPGVNAIGSGLIGKLSRGKHGKMITDAEMRVIATWIDLNATFYGCYEEPWLTKQLKGEPIPMPERQ